MMPHVLRNTSRPWMRILGSLCLASVMASTPIAPVVLADDGDQAQDEPIEDAARTDGSAPVGEPPAAGFAAKSSASKANVTVEALVMGRDDLQNVPFTASGRQGVFLPFVPFTASELQGQNYTPGMRVTLQGELFGQPIDLSGFYLNPMGLEQTKLDLGQVGPAAQPPNTNAVYHLENDPGADIDSVNSDNIHGMTVHHETKLFGGEANLVRPFGIPGLTVGARAIYFGEELGLTTMDTPADVPGNGAGSARDHVGIRIDNRLIGLQAGFQHMFEIGDAIRLGGSIKGGLFQNYVKRRRTFVSENRIDRSFDAEDSGDVFAQGVEINPRLEFRLSDNIFLSAAGSFLWLNNVSEALPHLANVTDGDDRSLRADGDAYFYGGSLGLTFLLDGLASSPEQGGFPLAPQSKVASATEIEERIVELEATEARKGNPNVSLNVSGSINRMLMAWDDGAKSDVYIVDNTAARSRLEFEGAAKIARGWSAGYFLSIGIDDTAANDVDQLTDNGENQIELRHSTWWLRSNQYGTVHVGLTSPATDDIILNDVGSIMPGAANISTVGGAFIVRRADSYEKGDDALITRTTLDDFAAGGGVDTLRRNVVRYDAPRISGLFGNLDVATAWGEDDFFDVAADHSLNYNDWKFRFGAGYLNDRDSAGRFISPNVRARRDRKEYKGSASLLHVPSGLFGTVAYVHRTFDGLDTSDQAVFGENTTGLVTPVGTNRPAIDYLYSAFGVRRAYSSFGDTSIYGEYARVDDAITGLREADLREVTDSRLEMFGAAVSQNLDAAAMDLYAGFRYFTFDTQGVGIRQGSPIPTPVPLTDIAIGYAGARIKF